MRSPVIKTFYSAKQVLEKGGSSNYSKSPKKPKLLLEYLAENDLAKHFVITDEFEPYSNEDFKIAHEESYVSEFFAGIGRCSSNSLGWSE